MIQIRVIGPDEWPVWRGLRQRALEEAPYAFGSRLSDWQGAGDTEPRWRERLSAVALNAIAEVDAHPAGMVSGSQIGDRVELLSLWVDPQFRGEGVGDRLVEAVVDWADSRQAAEVVLMVREGNPHARALYERQGFVKVGPPVMDENGVAENQMVRQACRNR